VAAKKTPPRRPRRRPLDDARALGQAIRASQIIVDAPTTPAGETLVNQRALFLRWTPNQIERFQLEMRQRSEAEAATGRTFHQGRRPGPWRDLVRDWHREGLSFREIWRRARRLADEQDHDILDDVLANNQGCPDHPRGWHWHCRDHRNRLRAVSAGRIKNVVSELRRR
jgi:hypothetical protein